MEADPVEEIIGPKSVDESQSTHEEVVAEICPELVIGAEGGPANHHMPLDPASSSFYPQQYPFYPMVFTPQQLPPNTSIIPLAGKCLFSDLQRASEASIFYLVHLFH